MKLTVTIILIYSCTFNAKFFLAEVEDPNTGNGVNGLDSADNLHEIGYAYEEYGGDYSDKREEEHDYMQFERNGASRKNMFAKPDKYEAETEDPLEKLLARDPVTMAPFEAPAEEDKNEKKEKKKGSKSKASKQKH